MLRHSACSTHRPGKVSLSHRVARRPVTDAPGGLWSRDTADIGGRPTPARICTTRIDIGLPSVASQPHFCAMAPFGSVRRMWKVTTHRQCSQRVIVITTRCVTVRLLDRAADGDVDPALGDAVA